MDRKNFDTQKVKRGVLRSLINLYYVFHLIDQQQQEET